MKALVFLVAPLEATDCDRGHRWIDQWVGVRELGGRRLSAFIVVIRIKLLPGRTWGGFWVALGGSHLRVAGFVVSFSSTGEGRQFHDPAKFDK